MVLVTGKDGSLHEMLLRESSAVERGQLIAVRGVSALCSLFSLSDNYVALVGLQKQKQGVCHLCIYTCCIYVHANMHVLREGEGEARNA